MTNIEKAFEFEEKFMFAEAIECYQNGVQELNFDDGSMIRYGELLFEFQDYEKAADIFRKIIEKYPENKDYLEKFAIINEELGNRKNAIASYEKIGDKDKVEKLEGEKSLDNPKQNLIEKFMDLFSGRDGVFSCQTDTGYIPIRHDLQKSDVKAHFNGRKTIGIYQLKENNSIKFAAFDVDIKKEWIISNDREKLDGKAKDIARKLYDKVNTCDLNPYAEFSGNKGYHVWIFFDSPVQAYKVKAIMGSILDSVDLYEEIDVEIFPKQIDVGNGLGNLIKIPMGIHKKTDRRCVFLDRNFQVVGNQAKFVLGIEQNESGKIDRIYNDLDLENYNVNSSSNNTQKRKTRIYSSIKSKITKKSEYEKNKEKLNSVVDGCNIVKQILERLEKSAYITEEEEYILIKSLEKIKNSREFLRENLSKSITYSPKKLSLLLNEKESIPITCEEIRKTILSKNININLDRCNCNFSDGYNSPYAITQDIELIFNENVGINELLSKIIEKNGVKFEIEKEIKMLKKLLAKKMGSKDKITTELGTIKRVDDDIEIVL